MEVSQEDVAGVIRLVREVCDRWDDPRSWREHLLHGACQLVNGHVGTIMADYDGQRGWFGDLAVIAAVGLPGPMDTMYRDTVSKQGRRRFQEVAEIDPGMGIILDQMRAQGWVTIAGNQIADEAKRRTPPLNERTDEATQHAAAMTAFRQHIDCDDSVVSVRIVDVPRRPEAITINRPFGATPFGMREIALLKLLHDEIAPLVGIRLTTEEHVSRDGLSKRLRETLSLLLEGYSEKQVAHQLQLGIPTIHDYVTMLYRHFQVTSRAELLAYFIRRAPLQRAGRISDSTVTTIQGRTC
ncbi:MAG TPA: LuxR C-terminal-related transcriptional regulator [Pirellulales bacterium]|jgi:DNA-binding CsgD family transcriptional regulator